MHYETNLPDSYPPRDSATAVFLKNSITGEVYHIVVSQFSAVDAINMLKDRGDAWWPRLHVVKGSVTILFIVPMWYRKAAARFRGGALLDEYAVIRCPAGDCDSFGEPMDLLTIIEARIRNLNIQEPEKNIVLLYE